MPFRWFAVLAASATVDSDENDSTFSKSVTVQFATQGVSAASINVELSNDAKTVAVTAHNSACCRHIYSTALQYLQHHHSEVQLDQQFNDLLYESDFSGALNNSCSIGYHALNAGKNRYQDVVPFDNNRVALPTLSSNSSQCFDTSSSMAYPSYSLDSNSVGSWDLTGRKYSALSNSSRQSSTISNYSRSCSSNCYSRCSSLSVPDDTYINASFLSDTRAALGGSSTAVGYIATQGPLPNTISDFWRMVWSTNVSAIVMLTELTMTTIGHGSSRAVCAAYFPDQENDCLQLPGGITVTCVFKKHLTDSLLFRQLEIVQPAIPAFSSPTGEAQSEKRIWVNHYKIAGWPDHGVPRDTTSVRTLSQALDSCRRAGCKIVAHCSAGVGRTGTFIAVDILLQRLQSLTLQPHGSVSEVQIRAAMDIPTLVADLRKQRRGSVQTSGQYAFIWRALMDELEQLLGQDME